jgi:hypothetical protein
MTHIYCKSDCAFSDNDRRLCSLEVIELGQMLPQSPQLNCTQYVRREKQVNSFVEVDWDRSRAGGVWGLKEFKV